MRFNEKFSPQWRPRYLVYESRAASRAPIVRVLQAEGYLPAARRAAWPTTCATALPGRRGGAAATARAVGQVR